MNHLRRPVVLAACLLLGLSAAALAQTRSPWSLELAGGNGRYPTHVGATWFEDGVQMTVRASGTWRVGPSRPLSVYMLADYENFPPYHPSGVDLVCRYTPDGTGCLQRFFAPTGLGLGVGAQQQLLSFGTIRAAAGVGHLQWLEKPKAGAAWPFIEGDAALHLGHHAAFVVGVRHMWWSIQGQQYWFTPVTYGLRVF